jgi:hypothetical protein
VEEQKVARNIKVWFGFCPNGHMPLFEGRKPNEVDACANCGGGVMVRITGAGEGYVSHDERARGVASSHPLHTPNAAPSPARL